MRFPALPTIVRTFYTLANVTTRPISASQRIVAPLTRGTLLRSMPTLPFLGTLFSSSASSRNMTYPVEKSDNEWQAVLNKGKQICSSLENIPLTPFFRTISCFARKGDRSPLHRHLRQAHAQHRHLHLRWLRSASLQGNAQIQIRLWLACLLRLHTGSCDETHR